MRTDQGKTDFEARAACGMEDHKGSTTAVDDRCLRPRSLPGTSRMATCRGHIGSHGRCMECDLPPRSRPIAAPEPGDCSWDTEDERDWK